MAFEIRHVVTPSSKDLDLMAEVHAFFAGQGAGLPDHLQSNYAPRPLDLDNHLVFSVMLSGSKIAGCAGIYNAGRYAPGVFRILNRSYVHSDYRMVKGQYDCLLSRSLLTPQLEICREHLKFIFVSRQGRFGHRFLEFWRRRCAPPGFDWRISKGFAHVAPAGKKRDCYQAISYAGESLKEIPLAEISEREWEDLPCH